MITYFNLIMCSYIVMCTYMSANLNVNLSICLSLLCTYANHVAQNSLIAVQSEPKCYAETGICKVIYLCVHRSHNFNTQYSLLV